MRIFQEILNTKKGSWAEKKMEEGSLTSIMNMFVHVHVVVVILQHMTDIILYVSETNDDLIIFSDEELEK